MRLCWIILALVGSPLGAASLDIDAASNKFSFAALRNAGITLGVNGSTHAAKWDAQASRFTLQQAGIDFNATLRQRDTNYLVISATIRNNATKPILLGRATLADGQVALGNPTVALLMSGWGVWIGVKPITPAKQISKTLTQLYNPSTHASLQIGFETFDRINTEQELWFDEGSKQFRATAYCDFEGWQLKPGQSVATETLLIGAVENPLESLETWADHVRLHYKPTVWKAIPSGWVGWSWVDPFKIEQYEAVVRRNARAIREVLPGLGLDYIWISLGNLKDREAGNWLNWNEKLLPSGPRKLIADLKQMDFKLGLWSGAFWLSSRLTAEVAQLRDAFLLKDGKPMTVPHRELGGQYILDPTHPKTKAFLTNVFETYREWGIRYFMIDFLYSISGSTPGSFRPDGFYNKDLIPGPETYRAGLEIVRKAAGPETYLLSSTGPTFHNLGLLDGMRVGNDYGEGRPLDGPGKGFYPGTFVINSPSYWTSHQAASNALAMSWFLHNKLFIADSGNVLSVDQPIPLPDAQISATLFGINGSPLMLGDDIARLSPTRIELLRQQFPRLPEAATPLDLFESSDYPKLFHLKVHKSWDDWSLIAVFNYGKKDFEQTINLNQLGFKKRVVVWDHWQERYLGVHENQIIVSVPGSGVRYLRIAEERSYPWLLSTSLHVRQGQADIESVKWNQKTGEIEIEAARPAGYRGSIFLRIPKGMAASNPQGLYLAKDANDGSLIVRVPAEFDATGRFRCNLKFSSF